MNPLVQIAQVVALQDTTAILLMCAHKQSFELVTNAQEKIFDIETKKKISMSFLFFLLGINFIYKLEHALGINELKVVKDEIGGICFSIGAVSQSVFS